MSPREFDPELQETLGDPELIRIARLLSSAQSPEPPIDDAFRSGLRRQLMDQAWDRAEGRNAWWRRLIAPQGMAWAGAAALVVIVASVIFYTATQPPGGYQQIIVNSPLGGNGSVATAQAIPVQFNQPMDHPSTEAAVQITPATTATFSWSGDSKVMSVQPASGNLAPNTQYKVTIGAGARTQSGTTNPAPQTITFVTNTGPSATPTPTPAPTPSANPSLLTGVTKLTSDYPPSGLTYPAVWSSDSATLYFVGKGGALESISASGGNAKTLVPDGVSLPAIAPAGNKLAYLRGSNIEILDLTGGPITDVPVTAVPTTLQWVKDRLYWGSSAGLFRLEAGAPHPVADRPDSAGTFVSIAPDGKHAVVQVGDGLLLVQVEANKAASLCSGGCATTFEGWSPDGTRLIYGGTITDTNGRAVSSIPPAGASGDLSWSAFGQILVGSDTSILEVRPDGSDSTALATGTFHLPVWAPNATTFAFTNGAGLYVATAPAPTAPPPAADQALRVVNLFMDARLKGLTERANQFLDDAGKAAYAKASPVLIPLGTPSFRRYYVVTSEVDPSDNSVRYVVRLVFAQDKVEQYSIDETLTLEREQATDPYLIDGATAAPQVPIGKGPVVVAVKITAAEVDVTFDSDLVATSISNVTLQDAQGMQVQGTVSYKDRTVTFTGLQLTPGAHYRLVVLPGLQDIANQNAAAEYDLDLVGPAPDSVAGGVTPSPSPVPPPAVTPSPSASPS